MKKFITILIFAILSHISFAQSWENVSKIYLPHSAVYTSNMCNMYQKNGTFDDILEYSVGSEDISKFCEIKIDFDFNIITFLTENEIHNINFIILDFSRCENKYRALLCSTSLKYINHYFEDVQGNHIYEVDFYKPINKRKLSVIKVIDYCNKDNLYLNLGNSNWDIIEYK